MPLPPSTRLGPYEITTAIGSGGMGEVYRARDTRLNRVVAIKVLLAGHASRPELRQRFEREARLISSLNHPNICVLYDVGRHEDIDYLVMEYLEGETLADRLRKGPIPQPQLLRIAIQIAEALELPHRQGLAHRDLKPGNVMLTKSGVKLLDFGLARPTGLRAPTQDEPTLTGPITEQGAIVGTVQYMAPEQLEGKPFDTRSDMFAFGAILYEMATGRRPFEGESVASTIAAILEKEPPSLVDRAPSHPPALDWIVRHCLKKDPDERWQTVHDVKLQLQRLAENVPDPAPLKIPATGWGWRMGIGLAAGAVIALVAVSILHWSEAPDVQPALQYEIHSPLGTTFASQFASVPVTQFALSPDGTKLAFIASSGGPPQLWIRRLDETNPRLLPGTGGAAQPFWSPDSNWVAFFAQSKLKKVDTRGGSPQIVAEGSPDPRGGSWGKEGVIIYALPGKGIYKVPASGGTAVAITSPDQIQGPHRWPHFLPDGRAFIYTIRVPDLPKRGIYISSLDDATSRLLRSSEWGAVFAEPGYLLFLEGGMLMAQRFDPARRALEGEAFPAAQPAGGSSSGECGCSVSRNGILAFTPAISPPTRPTWLDRSGRASSAIDPPGDYIDFRLSPDENQVALSRVDPTTNTPDIWIHDMVRGVATRSTFHPMTEAGVQWSPDGLAILFRSNIAGFSDVYRKSAFGGTNEELWFGGTQEHAAHNGSPAFLMSDYSNGYTIYTASTSNGYDVWAVLRPGDSPPLPQGRTPFNEMHGNLSPDGRWLAFTSDESGKFEVHVQAFPKPNDRWQVSTAGGSEPRWRGDGRELYYISQSGKLMAVTVVNGGARVASAPVELFPVRLPAGVNPFRTNYVPNKAGTKFLVNTLEEQAEQPSIVVVSNWLKAAESSR
ncbi:MAG: protein kinase domain-containing protein [Bryobacteraceae bacterium]